MWVLPLPILPKDVVPFVIYTHTALDFQVFLGGWTDNYYVVPPYNYCSQVIRFAFVHNVLRITKNQIHVLVETLKKTPDNFAPLQLNENNFPTLSSRTFTAMSTDNFGVRGTSSRRLFKLSLT